MKQRLGTTGLTLSRALAAGAAAGVAGGLAEVAYMGVYSHLTGMEAAGILRLVTFTFFDAGVSFGPNGPLLGLLIHFALSLAIGLSFGLFARYALPRFTYTRALVWGLVSLAAIWAMNFYIILPEYNMAFVRLVSPEAALFSKLSFGVLLAIVMKLFCTAGRKAAPAPSTGRRDAPVPSRCAPSTTT
ncbi:MAG: hypothetical protein ACE5GY_02710 [Thermodesulfobacteriota bacterium]